MNLTNIIGLLDSINEIRIIGKEFSINGTNCHLVGLYRSFRTLHAVLLSFNEEQRDRREQAEIEEINGFDLDGEPTVRESERAHIIFDEPVLQIRRITSKNTVLKSGESECSLLSNEIDKNIILLSEFIRAGWRCERFADISFDDYYIHDIVFNGEFDSIPDISKEITLSFGRESKRTLAEIPVALKIGSEEKEIDLDEKGKIYIRETKLVDMYAEMEKSFENEQFQKYYSPEEIHRQRTDFENNFSEQCPKGKFYAAVEYEAPENISVDIKLKSVLDSPPVPKDSCMAFLLGSDLLPVHDGMKVKTAVVDAPLDGDTEILDAEIFSVYEVSKPEEIKLL